MSESYEKLLKDPRWQEKRKRMLERDHYECRECRLRHSLEVHHLWYIPNRDPWEYPNDALVTLCNACHAELHRWKEAMVQRLHRATVAELREFSDIFWNWWNNPNPRLGKPHALGDIVDQVVERVLRRQKPGNE